MNKPAGVCARILFGKLLPRRAYPVLRGPLTGARFILGALAGEAGGASVYFNMIEPEQTSALAHILKKGEVFFDIGANVGYYTILGARIVGSQGRVFAFEPAIRNLAYLYQHTVLNKASNVTIVSAACSDTVSLAALAAGENFATGRMAESIRPEAGDQGLLSPVPTVTIDAVVQQTGVYPDVIKIDVEGAEESVLRGARETLHKTKPSVLLSTHSNELRSNCLKQLENLGYTFEVLSRDKTNPSEFAAKYMKA